MKITDIRVLSTRLPASAAAMVQVETDEGVVGVGATSAPALVQSGPESMRAVLTGSDPTNTNDAWRSMFASGNRGRSGEGGLAVNAMAAVDMALWDIPELDAVGEDAVFPINPHIKRVVDYAQSTGVHLASFGEPSARVREYRKDRPDWKVQTTEDPNKVLKQNCQANDEYSEWFYRFICNTIDSCKLKG